MPRVSAAASAVPIPLRRLKAPPKLPATERKVFETVVASLKPSHFGPEDLQLLLAYCTAVVLERDLSVRLGKAVKGGLEERIASLGQEHGRAALNVVKLARAIRVGPISRAANNRRPSSAVRSPDPQPRQNDREISMSADPDWRPWRQ